MELRDRICVVTGAASGIGKALAQAFKAEGARLVVCSDIDRDGVAETAAQTGGIAFTTDVSSETDIQHLIETVEADYGPIDLFCSNAGIATMGGLEVSNEDWQKIWEVNTMAHVWAARHVVPRMIGRGGGYLLNTASAGWPAVADRLGTLCRHQARCSRPGRMAGVDLW